jgi:NDP-sugar pyrophosphorylase family protein
MMHLIVPMAGLGQRFRDEGYALPKPLIDVSGMPMVVRAVRDLPACERMTFLVHPDHVREHAIDRRLRDYFPQAAVIATPGLTAGQACTVRLASTAVDDDEKCWLPRATTRTSTTRTDLPSCGAIQRLTR